MYINNHTGKKSAFRYFLMIGFFVMSMEPVMTQDPATQQLHPAVRQIASEGSREDFIKFKKSVNLTSAQFITQYRSPLGLTADDDVRVIKTESDPLGFVHYSTQQYHNGIPVAFAELKLHEKQGRLNTVNGTIVKNLSVNTTPGIAEADALTRALSHVGATLWAWEVEYLEEHIKEHENDPNATFYPKGELWITSPLGVSDKNGENFVLTWRFEVYDADLEKAQVVFVNASTGQIVNSYPLVHNCIAGTGTTNFYGTKTIHTDSSGGVYRLDADCAATHNVRIHTRLLTGMTLTEITDSNNVWNAANQASAVTSHWGMEVSVNYFQLVHARNSYNGSGGDINIHQGVPFVSSGGNNASFESATGIMRIGIGPTAADADDINALDVVAHELGHGVTGSSAGLVYQGESGALNESYSDIWGTAVEYFSGGGDWSIGEDLAIGAIRSMSNPNAFGDPDTYNGTNWKSTVGNTAATDWGGVHSNSGVQNKWFQLLVDGGSGTNDNGDDYNVKGIGLASASKIAYRNLTQYLNSGSNYMDARDNAIQAAEDLFMECSDEWIATQNAWYAVGVGDPALMIDSTSMEPTACDSMNGKLYVRVKGVLGTAQYQWSDPMMQTTQEATDLDKGMYTVTITDDDNGCMVDTTLEVEDDANFMLMAMATDVTACGADDGMADAATTGVTGTPEIMWSNGANTQMIMNLAAGEYSVTVTDTSTMCVLDTMLEIKEDEIMVNIAGGGSRTFCEDDNDREITLSAVATGCGMCTYTWSTGAMGESIMVTTAGTFSVTAMDTSMCEGMASTEVQIWERDCDDCDVSWFWSLFGFGDCDEWMIPRLHAVDPNDITGPTGYDSAHWVSVHDDMAYTVRFENDPSFATAPAQVVRITVPIEEDLNLFSFNLGSFGFGDFLFEIPPGTAFFQKRYDVTDPLGVVVDFTAGIDVTKHEAFWIFESIDPLTNLPPEDALLGFLPVNDTTVNIYNDTMTQQGEGFVNFSLKPKSSLMTGDTTHAQASIIFDINAPLATNIWTNLIDAGNPVSQIDSAVASAENYILYFSGEDDPGGTGIATYDLYASYNGSPFAIYEVAIDTNFFVVSGEEGAMYSFYTLAKDNVGNQEEPKTTGEVTITFGETAWPGGPIVYVDLDAVAGANNGTSWEDALLRLSDALALARTFDNIEEIWVAQGTYYPTADGDRSQSLSLSGHVKVYGGFEGVEVNREDRDPTVFPVILSGEIGVPSDFTDNSYNVVEIDSLCTDCVLDGVEVAFGYATGLGVNENAGAGILSFGDALLSDVQIRFCFALNTGAAIFNTGPSARLQMEDCLVSLNISILDDKDVLNTNGAGIEFVGMNTIRP